MLKDDNRAYNNQISILAVIASLTFKVVMLPKYMTEVAGNMAFVSVAIMMLLDVIGYLLVTYVIRRVNIMKLDNKWLIAPIMLGLLVMLGVRMVVLSSETLTYINGTLFDQGRIAFVLLALAPFPAYIVYKGGNSIARLAQILFWFILAGIGFTIIFARLDLDFLQLTPMFNDGFAPIFKGCNDHYLWFGDYIPFLFLQIIPEKNKQGKPRKNTFPLILLIIYIATVFFYMIFTSVYGDAGGLVMFAFNKMAIFNKISALIGPTNFPAVITWLLMSIIKLSLILYAMTMALTYFIKRKWLAILINVVTITAVIGLAVPSVEASYALGTGWVKYIAAVVQYITPIVLAIYVKVKYDKKIIQA